MAALKLLNVTKNMLFLEINGINIYSIFDTPDLYNNFRNHFIKSNFVLQGEEASFQYIRDVYNINKNSSTSHSLIQKHRKSHKSTVISTNVL